MMESAEYAEVTKGEAEVMKGAVDEKADESCRGGRVILDLTSEVW